MTPTDAHDHAANPVDPRSHPSVKRLIAEAAAGRKIREAIAESDRMAHRERDIAFAGEPPSQRIVRLACDEYDAAMNPVDPKPVDGDREGITEALTRVVMDHAPGLHPIGDREAANIARAVLSALRQRGRLVEGDGWIACSERMPETKDEVLVSDGCSHPTAAWTGEGRWVFVYDDHGEVPFKPTHWRPLPAPPSPGATGSEAKA